VTADDPTGTTTRRRGVSLATRLAASAVAVSFAALGLASAVGINAGVSLGREIYEDRIVSLSNAASDDVAAAVASTTSAVVALALSPATAVGIDAFDTAIDQLELPADFDLTDTRGELLDDYAVVYSSQLASADDDVSLEAIVPRDPVAVYLQSLYSFPDDDSRPAAIDDADDGSTWSETHAAFQPSMRRFVDELGLTDLYLVEPDAERIVFSVEKRSDLGTSLRSGPYSGTVLANTVAQVLDDPAAGAAVSDVNFYDPTPNEVVGVIAAPVFDGTTLVGVAAALYDGKALTRLLTNDGDWETAGFDDTADAYVVGADGTLRTDPRPYLEDPRAFLDGAEAAGSLTPDERRRIESLGSTILILSAADATLAAATDGISSIGERPALDGDRVFGISARLVAGDPTITESLDWQIVTEIDVEEAEAALDQFRNLLIVGTAVFLIAAAFFAVAWANRTMAPVRAISDRLADPDGDQGPLSIDEASPLEFHYLGASFQRMAAVLRHQHGQLAIARQERLDLMQQMLPTAVAERVAAGDLDELDEVAQTSVAVVVVLGLGELVQEGGAAGRAVVESLHAELDQLAEHHGLDRIKVVGDAYFASCGHSRPYIDHAPRAVAFATDARDAVDVFGERTDAGLDAAIGVHTGPVTIGMVGDGQMIFDVWGDTVSYAHLLARRARREQILLSEQTHGFLPAELVTEPVAADTAAAPDAESTSEPTWSVPLTTVGGRT